MFSVGDDIVYVADILSADKGWVPITFRVLVTKLFEHNRNIFLGKFIDSFDDTEVKLHMQNVVPRLMGE